MIGYKCNACDDEISEKKYRYLKSKGELKCLECKIGFYEPYFKDEKNLNLDDFDIDVDSDKKDDGITDKMKSLAKRGNNLPGATPGNRVIGTLTLGFVGGALLRSLLWWNGFFAIGAIIGGIAGFYFAPYFVPTLKKWTKKFFRWLTKDRKKK
jgi:hypothetical protein